MTGFHRTSRGCAKRARLPPTQQVELEGTSGEGSVQVGAGPRRKGACCLLQEAASPPSHAPASCFSVQVKAFKPTAAKLFEPLAAALLATPAACAPSAEPGMGVEGDREARLLAALLEVYEWPDRHPGGSICGVRACWQVGSHRHGPQQRMRQACHACQSARPPCLPRAGLYNFCKALEALETGVLGGFYFKVRPGGLSTGLLMGSYCTLVVGVLRWAAAGALHRPAARRTQRRPANTQPTNAAACMRPPPAALLPGHQCDWNRGPRHHEACCGGPEGWV